MILKEKIWQPLPPPLSVEPPAFTEPTPQQKKAFLKALTKNRKKLLISKQNSLPDMIAQNDPNLLHSMSVPASPKSNKNSPQISNQKSPKSKKPVYTPVSIDQLEQILESVNTVLGNRYHLFGLHLNLYAFLTPSNII